MWRRILVAVLLFAGVAAYAQTPDGETPANEGVCDVLIGATPGLYGLCVAFCEAQDWADEDVPITEAEFELLKNRSPSGRILTAYNRKKTDSDPDMPCILVEEACPCWTAEELASFDGLLSDGSVAQYVGCYDNTNPIYRYQGMYENGQVEGSWERLASRAGPYIYGPFSGYCLFYKETDDPPDLVYRFLRVDNETLTPEQADACWSAHQAQQAAFPCP